MCVLVVFFLIMFWLLIEIFFILYKFEILRFFFEFYLFISILVMLNFCFNFIIYCFSNREYWKEFCWFFCCINLDCLISRGKYVDFIMRWRLCNLFYFFLFDFVVDLNIKCIDDGVYILSLWMLEIMILFSDIFCVKISNIVKKNWV